MSTKYQDKFGYPVQRTAGKVRSHMAPWIQEFIQHSPFCVMATSNAVGDCDASPKGGTPGFVKILNDKQLFIPIAAPVRWSLVSNRVQGFAGNRYARHTLTDLQQQPGSQ